MLLGLTALTWIILIPATLCWPAVGLVIYFIWRSAKRHDGSATTPSARRCSRPPPAAAGPAARPPRAPSVRRVIGIALLTLVPGELGGSESATRELLRALARGGTLPYRVYLPPVAPDARRGAARRRSSAEYRPRPLDSRPAARR